MTDELSDDIVFTYPDWQANTFHVDCTGRRAVLAVQKWLAVVSLDRSESRSEPKALRKLARQNKYDVKAVLWCPHQSQQDLLASTSQQKVEVWNVNVERHPLLCSIKAHTRPVSDLSWSFTDPNLLASCAVDSFVHVWDIRENRRPKTSFKAVAGASLVQWNRVNGNFLASAHDSDIRIWDMRKSTTASGYITAHMSRIHDLDWSYSDERQLTTCSHDASIKFWDTSTPREPTSSIKAGAQPLWRARNYPLGHAVAMVLVPAIHGGDSRVFLWNRNNVSSPRHIFTGHSESVLEVQWRKHRGGYQLVSWSKDRTMRIWGMSEQLKEDLGGGLIDHTTVEDQDSSLHLQLSESSMATESEGEQFATTEDPPHTPSPLKSIVTTSAPMDSSSRSSPSQSMFQPQLVQTLAQEFSLLNLDNIPNLEMERLEASQRSCTVKVEYGEHLVRVGISFPSHYPNGAAPSFTFDNSTTIDFTSQQDLNRIISETAQSYVKQSRPCLEPCLRKLAKTLESFVSRPQPPSKQPDFDIFGHLNDEHIPFPRTSGARFCANGMLVCFNIPPGLVLPAEVTKTPRSLDKMNTYRSHIRPVGRAGQARGWSGYLSSSLPKRGSGSNLLQIPAAEKPTMSLFARDKGFKGEIDPLQNPYVGLVIIHNIAHMLPIDYHLARAYSLSGSDIKELCAMNASVAVQHNRVDLVQAWSAVALIANRNVWVPPDADSGMPWSQHPFGRQLIHSLFDHFGRLHDVQTLAMLACVFQLHCLHYEEQHNNTANMNNYGSISAYTNGSTPAKSHSPVSQGGPSPPKRVSQNHTNERGQETDSEFQEKEDRQEEMSAHEKNCRLLDDVLTRKCDEYRRSYANILYCWEMLDQRAEVLKFQVARDDPHTEIGFASLCRDCGELVRGPACVKSRCFASTCSVCNLSVRGGSNFCLSCGHGGHAKHMLDWFTKYSVCPAGCGCKCLEAGGWT